MRITVVQLQVFHFWLSAKRALEDIIMQASALAWYKKYGHSRCINIGVFIDGHCDSATGNIVHFRTSAGTRSHSNVYAVRLNIWLNASYALITDSAIRWISRLRAVQSIAHINGQSYISPCILWAFNHYPHIYDVD